MCLERHGKSGFIIKRLIRVIWTCVSPQAANGNKDTRMNQNMMIVWACVRVCVKNHGPPVNHFNFPVSRPSPTTTARFSIPS